MRIKGTSFRNRFVLAIAVSVLATICDKTQGSIILDFNSIPDGTLLSSLGPFEGGLTLQGQENEQWGGISPDEEVGSRSVSAGVFTGGRLHLDITLDPWTVTQDLLSVHYQTIITGTFQTPVTALSFNSSGDPYHWYNYSGIGPNGAPFKTWGETPHSVSWGTDWTTVLSAPVGGYITGFEIMNGDIALPRYATLGLDNVAFTPVPETFGWFPAVCACLILFGTFFRRERV